ncbi:MAG: hypothetical protein ACP5VR_07190 [Acidimicrobiales bacterium]
MSRLRQLVPPRQRLATMPSLGGSGLLRLLPAGRMVPVPRSRRDVN